MLLLAASSLSLSQTSSVQFGDRNPTLLCRHHRLLTEKQIFSSAYYYTIGTNDNAVRYHTILAVLFTDHSVYFYVSKMKL